MTNKIEATASRKHNGWVARLEFPNYGAQEGATLHGTMARAVADAEHMLRLRLAYPAHCVRDPQPGELIRLGAKLAKPTA